MMAVAWELIAGAGQEDCTSARTSEILQLIFKLIFKFQRKKGGHIKVRDMKKIKK
jgi:hypothetical protein